MKRVEVKLSLPVVAPLLDVIKGMADDLAQNLAIAPGVADVDPEFQAAWNDDLLAAQNEDVKTLLGLFNEEFFTEGVVVFDASNAEPIVRACAAVRLKLRFYHLKSISDEALETGETQLAELDEPTRKAFMCYVFLATIQELIVQHLDESILG